MIRRRRPRLSGLAARHIALCWLPLSGLLLAGMASAANLVPNSSFEAGVDSRLAIGRWYVDGLSALALDPADPVHGRYSLRVPYSRAAYRSLPRTTDGIEVRSAAGVRVSAGQLYSLTAYVRSDAPVQGSLSLLPTPPDGRAEGAPVASREILVGRSWRRVGLSFRAARDQDLYWDLTVRSERPGAVWLDAVQLEAGPITPYAPASAVEAGVAVAAEGAVFTAGEFPTVQVTAFNNGDAAVTQGYDFLVRDLSGGKVHAGSLGLELPAGGGAVQSLRLPALRNGIYSLQLTPRAAATPESEVHFAVLPPRRDVPAEQGAFGIYATVAPEPLRILRRAGFSWLASLTANGRMIYWDAVEPREGEFVWYDDELRLAGSLGFAFMFNLEPCKTPGWAQGLSRPARIERWSRYVRAMAEHYGATVKYWTIADEVSQAFEADDWRHACWQTAAEYLPWHVAGVQALRAANTGARAMLNVDPAVAVDLLAALPPGSVDILADNAWHFPERMERWPPIMQRFGIGELWAPGVAINEPPWYAGHRRADAGADAPGFWADRNREITEGVVRTLAAGARRVFQYTGSFVGNTNAFSLFEADSSLKPIGVQFASLAWLLDGSLRAARLPLTGAAGRLDAYRFERRDGLVVYPLFGPPAAEQRLRLPGLSPGELRAYDHFANPLDLRAAAGGAIELPVGREPVFLVASAAAAPRVEQALAGFALRLDALPAADRVEQAGDYAILRGYRDGLERPDPNLSLWFRSPERGWTELLRFRASSHLPDYRVSPAGFEIRWQFQRGRAPFYLEPGQWPAGLMAGATVRRSREPLTLVIEGPATGFAVRVRTTLTGDPALYDEQPATPGGWQLLSRPGDDHFLHQYYREGPAGPVDIRVRLDVLRAGTRSAE